MHSAPLTNHLLHGADPANRPAWLIVPQPLPEQRSSSGKQLPHPTSAGCAVVALYSSLALVLPAEPAGDRNKQRFELLVPQQQVPPKRICVERTGARVILGSIVLRHPGEKLNSGLASLGWQLLGAGHSDPRSQCLT